jgi:uncharacterized protein
MELAAFAAAGVLVAVFASFVVSASAGLGGSLVLVPSLGLVLGPKEGVALAALLLGANNVAKIVAYRATLPFRSAAVIVALTSVGAAFGASLLVRVPETVVGVAVIAALALTLLVERSGFDAPRRGVAAVLALGSGGLSGFSGTSGPLKGVAVRSLGLDRRHLVGAASLASLVGDLTKAVVYARADLLGTTSLVVVAAAVPLMVGGTALGRRLNGRLGEPGFAVLFWSVMTGYSVRVGLVLL